MIDSQTEGTLNSWYLSNLLY